MTISVDQFVDAVEQSGLLSKAELTEFRESLPPEARDEDAKGLAHRLVSAGKLTKYQAAAIYQGKPDGLVLGNYVLLDKIGAGGMGQVYKAEARHQRMNRIVALKVLLRRETRSPDSVQRFYREVKAAAHLTHPNIVTAHDADEHRGVHYLVMEYVDGEDLTSLVDAKGPLPVNQALNYIIQAGKGLAFAHEKGIVHRDIKPANILVGRDGTAKILDLGLAHVAPAIGGEAGANELTQSGQIMGTVNYMAPEQALDTHAADARADVYSLGCTLYRVLTGEVPFPSDNMMKTFVAHREAAIPSLRAARSDVSPQLDDIFQKMMAKLPEDRYQTMTETVTALQGCFAGETPLQPPSGGAVSKPPPVAAAPPLVKTSTESAAQMSTPPPAPPATNEPATARQSAPAVAPAPPRPRPQTHEETINIQTQDDTSREFVVRRIARRPKSHGLLYTVVGGGAAVILLLLGLAAAVVGLRRDLAWDGSKSGATDVAGQSATEADSDNISGAADAGEAADEINRLSEAEQRDGWELLFDGRTTIGWRAYRGTSVPSNWTVHDDALYCNGAGGESIITTRSFTDFELRFQWKISPGGNSGVFYRASEEGRGALISGVEYQVLDDDLHPNGKNALTSAGSIYGMYAPLAPVEGAFPPVGKMLRPVGQFNDATIIVRGDRIEHWLNGRKIVGVVAGDDEWLRRTQTRPKTLATWSPSGYIGLQDHRSEVWYRNIKVRPL